jgi:hypothetical protein
MPCLKLFFDKQKPPKFYWCNINALTKMGYECTGCDIEVVKKTFSEIRKYNGATIHTPPLV